MIVCKQSVKKTTFFATGSSSLDKLNACKNVMLNNEVRKTQMHKTKYFIGFWPAYALLNHVLLFQKTKKGNQIIIIKQHF